jgi:hypothetical protein
MRCIGLALVLIAMAASAEARGRSYSAGGQVVHSRRAPVIMHRAVPPFGGVHVYDKSEAPRRAERGR